MAGILANSASKTMVSGDTSVTNSVSGYVVGEQISLTTTLGDTSIAWSQVLPVSATLSRSKLSDSSGSAVTFTPDAAGIYVIVGVVDETTSYTLDIAVLNVATTTLEGSLLFQPLASTQVPAPSVGKTVYNDADNGLVYKLPDNSITPIGGGGSGNVTGPGTSVDGNLAAFSGTDGQTIADAGSSVADILAYVDGAESDTIAYAENLHRTARVTNITFADSPYTVLATDEAIRCATLTGAITVILPDVTTGRDLDIEDADQNAPANPITVQRFAIGELINGSAADLTIATSGAMVRFESDATAWLAHESMLSGRWQQASDAAESAGSAAYTAQSTIDTHVADLANPHAVTATQVGLGSVVNAGFGSTSGTYCEGSDARLSDARTPTAHASTHVTNGGDTIADAVAAGNSGLMSGADKTKLDGITAGANTLSSYGTTDNAVLRADGTGTHTGQGSLVTIDDSGNVSMAASATVDGRDVSVDGAKLDLYPAVSGLTTGQVLHATGAATTAFGALDPSVSAAFSVGGDVPWGSHEITSLADPTAATSAANRQYVDAAVFYVEARTTAALPAYTYNNGTAGVGATITANANGAFPTLDGYVSLAVGDRFYLANGSSSAHNGVYSVTSLGSGSSTWSATRSTRVDTAAKIPGSMFRVRKGLQCGGGEYTYLAQDSITVGTTALFWRRVDNRIGPNEGFRYFDDFTYISNFGTANGVFSLGYAHIGQIGTGAQCVGAGVNSATERGVVSCSTGTVNNSIVGLWGGWTSAGTQPDGGDCFAPGANIGFDVSWRVTAPALSTSAQEYALCIGLSKQRAAQQKTPADFVGFMYDRSATAPVTTSGNMNLHWVAIAGSGGTYTSTVTDTGVTVTAGTYNVLRIVKDAGSANVRYYVDGVLYATFSTNIPTTTLLSNLCSAFKSVGTTSINALRIDWVNFELDTPGMKVAA